MVSGRRCENARCTQAVRSNRRLTIYARHRNMTASKWTLHCSACTYSAPGDRLASVCPDCGQPLSVKLAPVPRSAIGAECSMWRYHAAMPILDGEQRISIGEGMTAITELPHIAKETGVRRLWVKDEGLNPTASFKA